MVFHHFEILPYLLVMIHHLTFQGHRLNQLQQAQPQRPVNVVSFLQANSMLGVGPTHEKFFEQIKI